MTTITKAELKLFNQLNQSDTITNLKLKVDFPYKDIYNEVLPLLDDCVTHRTNDNGDHQIHFGWKGLVLRGHHWYRTGDWQEGDPKYHRWTELADINDAREKLAAAGTTSAALAYGGDTPSVTANTESWNGSSWTEVSNLNTARKDLS